MSESGSGSDFSTSLAYGSLRAGLAAPAVPSSPVEVGGHLPRLTLASFLADVAARHAEREALVFAGRRTTYRELEAGSRRLARALVGAGVVKGAHVAVLAGNRPEWVTALFAVGLVGGVLVPVNTFATQEERDYILRHSDASLLLLQPALLQHAYLDDLLDAHPELAKGDPGRLQCAALPQLRRVVTLSLDRPPGTVQPLDDFLALGEGVSDALLDETSAEVAASDDSVIVYTSGTTARPKAVLHMQRALLVNSLRFSRWLGLTPRDRVFTAQPFFWTAGIAMSLCASLDAGACLVLQESFEPEAALDLLERERVTALHAWAHQHKALAEHPSAPGRDLRSLRHIGPESPLAKIASVRAEEESFGLQGSYGLSETFTIFATLPASAPRELRLGSSGVPLPGNRVRIVDPTNGAPLGTGEHGEIAVKGYTLMRGYYKVDPTSTFDEDGYFHTGDGGFVDSDGLLHWTGRISAMIKTGGANVSPLEIEDALAGYEPLLVAAPVGVPHPALGEAIVLCAVRRENTAPVSEDQIRTHLRKKLAAYKVPKRVLFFRADEIAYTGNQKLRSEPLRQQALARLRADRSEIEGHVYRG
jgi:acyl-CoA synthetase (AMP-forming)/AMP-acid ligase II